MKNVFVKAVGLFFLLGTLLATSGILELQAESIGEILEDKEYVLVEFYADWCDHCKYFAPEYERIAETLENEKKEIIVARINGELNKQVTEYVGLAGYPAIVLFFHGHPIHYEQHMDYDNVMRWIKEVLVREPAKITTTEGFKSLEENLNQIHVFIGNEEDENYLKIRHLAKVMSDIPVFTTMLTEVAERQEHEYTEFFMISFKNKETIPYHGELEADSLKKFGLISQAGHLVRFNREKFAELMKNNIPILCLFSEKGDQKLESWADELKYGYQSHLIAMKFEDKNSPEEKMIWEFCNIGSKPRAVCIIESTTHLMKYQFHKRLSLKNINGYIGEFLSGKLRPYVKTEKIEEQFTGEIMNLNSQSFEELLSRDTDIFKLIYFYKDDCPKCKLMVPIVSKLAEELKNRALIIGRINMSKNEIPEMIGHQFPMLAVLRTFQDDSSSIYSEEWEIDQIRSWIEAKAPNVKDNLEKYQEDIRVTDIDL